MTSRDRQRLVLGQQLNNVATGIFVVLLVLPSVIVQITPPAPAITLAFIKVRGGGGGLAAYVSLIRKQKFSQNSQGQSCVLRPLRVVSCNRG